MSLAAEGNSWFSYDSGVFWLTVGLVILTILLIAIGLWTFRRDRRGITWEKTVTPLLRPDDRVADRLKVTWDDEDVTDPTLTTIRMRNTGRRDIGADLFDNKRPIELRFPGGILTMLEPAEDDYDGLLPYYRSEDTIVIGPGLLKKGTELEFVVLTRANEECKFFAPLDDVSIKEGRPGDQPDWGRVLRRTWWLVLIALIANWIIASQIVPDR
jgi:hypothetical protein